MNVDVSMYLGCLAIPLFNAYVMFRQYSINSTEVVLSYDNSSVQKNGPRCS